MKQINVDRLAGEGLVTAGWSFGQQVRMIGYVYTNMIQPQIAGSQKAYEMERMLGIWKKARTTTSVVTNKNDTTKSVSKMIPLTF